MAGKKLNKINYQKKKMFLTKGKNCKRQFMIQTVKTICTHKLIEFITKQ